MPLLWIKWPADPITIALPRFTTGQIAMPDVATAGGQCNPHFLVIVIKQAQLHLFSMGRKQREIYPIPIKMSTNRCRGTTGKAGHSPSPATNPSRNK